MSLMSSNCAAANSLTLPALFANFSSAFAVSFGFVSATAMRQSGHIKYAKAIDLNKIRAKS
eukprot:4924174-Pyramimonas_sp.AAC.1